MIEEFWNELNECVGNSYGTNESAVVLGDLNV